jgi:cell division protein ZapA
MSRVSVTINNRQFRIECEDGHEGYLMDLAREVDNRISGLRSKSGEISDNGLMVMLAITVADELSLTRPNTSQLKLSRSDNACGIVHVLNGQLALCESLLWMGYFPRTKRM